MTDSDKDLMKETILATVENPNTRELVEIYFNSQELAQTDCLVSEVWCKKPIQQSKLNLLLNDCMMVAAQYTGHVCEVTGFADGLGFCVYRHGLEHGVIAGWFKNGHLNGVCLWIKSVMVAGNCSLHRVSYT